MESQTAFSLPDARASYNGYSTDTTPCYVGDGGNDYSIFFSSETLRSYPDVVPSVKALNEEEVELMCKALEVHKDWNCLHPAWKRDKPEQSRPIALFLQQNMCLLQVMMGKLLPI